MVLPEYNPEKYERGNAVGRSLFLSQYERKSDRRTAKTSGAVNKANGKRGRNCYVI